MAAAQTRIASNDRIRIATIGHGGMGSGDTRYALSIPGVELVAVCDIYEPHLALARKLAEPNAFATKHYKELLDRKDVDAVLIGSPDHWHVPMTVPSRETWRNSGQVMS